jgi:hypothetical protein
MHLATALDQCMNGMLLRLALAFVDVLLLSADKAAFLGERGPRQRRYKSSL